MSYTETSGPELIVQHTGQVFALGRETILIGRADDNTVVLSDPEVSAHHATITWQAGTYLIQDLGSTNGTFVNEQRVTEPPPLRHGDVVRVGNTVFDVRLGGSPPPPPPPGKEQGGTAGSPVLAGIIIVLVVGILISCCVLVASLLLSRGGGKPDVVIQSPNDGAQVSTDAEIIFQATASGVKDIVSLEIKVDGVPAATSASPDANGVSSLIVSTPYVFSIPGEHVISAMARTARGKTSRTESIRVTAMAPAGGIPTSTPTSVSGEVTSTPTPGDVTMTPGSATSTPEPGAPQIEFFRSNPASINAGGCTTLEWGKVHGADAVVIEPGVGDVATPGSTIVCPNETTTYVLTATGPGGTSFASAVVTVIGGLADLMIDSVSFDPNPPVRGQDTEVRVALRNRGEGAAGAFNWEWDAGSEGHFDGRIPGLNAGETTLVTVRWTPINVHSSLSTVARVDVNNEVIESDKGNNQLVLVTQVVEGSVGGSVTLSSEAELDGYIGNNGSRANRRDILVGNGEILDIGTDLVWRGFMSFDITGIPDTATIQSIELRFFQVKVGGDPYGKLGNLNLDHVDYGSSLTAAAFDTPSLDSAVLPPQNSPGVWYITTSDVVGNWLKSDLLTGRDRFQLRLRFTSETDGDGKEDYTAFESGNNFFGTGNLPQLVVSYGP